jgi:hypothetical protein
MLPGDKKLGGPVEEMLERSISDVTQSRAPVSTRLEEQAWNLPLSTFECLLSPKAATQIPEELKTRLAAFGQERPVGKD